jgi:hypothetical protein
MQEVQGSNPCSSTRNYFIKTVGLIGFAIYQSTQHNKTAKTETTAPAPNSTEGLAASAAKIVEQDAANDSALAAGAEASADELTAADSDITGLGDTSNASF